MWKAIALAATMAAGWTVSAETVWLSPDFKIIHSRAAHPTGALPPDAPADCRARIHEIVCLVDPSTDDGQNEDPLRRPCLPGSGAYAAPFEQLYDRFPAHLRKTYCGLRRIFIEKEFYATAYAGLTMDSPDGVPNGAIVGIRKDLVDQPFGLDRWSSWKEQLNFGGDPQSYAINPALPMIHSSSQDMLYYVLAHEFGHIFDFMNHLNRWDDCKFGRDAVTGTCVAARGSWSELGWANIFGQPKAGNDFPLRKALCFYGCNGNFIDPSRAGELYRGLFATNFISVYAASNPYEDWAEAFAFFTFQHELGATYALTLADGGRFDFIGHLQSAVMADKVNFVAHFLQGEIVYPGQKSGAAF
jgi:hypothetical protein